MSLESLANPNLFKAPDLRRASLFIPAEAAARILDLQLGAELSREGHDHLRSLVRKIIYGDKVWASQEMPLILTGSKFEVETFGQENIPSSGSTLFIGNHVRGKSFGGMDYFFTAVSTAYEARSGVADRHVREPYVIMQRGLGKANPLVRYLSGEFYERAAKTFDWEVVLIPRFDSEGQVVNHQRLPHSAIRRLIEGGAMFWYPQGKHTESDNQLNFPDKANSFLQRLRESVRGQNIQVVPLQVSSYPDRAITLHFGHPIPISQTTDINDFAQSHIVPLRI